MNLIKRKIIIFIIFLFILSRYLITLRNAFPQFIDNIELYIKLSIINMYFLSLLFVFKQIYLRKISLIIIGIYCFLYLSYQSIIDFSLTSLSAILIFYYLLEFYIKNKILFLKIIINAGFLYLLILLYLILVNNGLLVFINKAIWGRNYVGSVIFVFVIISIWLKNYRKGILGLLFLIILKFRTALLSLLIYFFILFGKKLKFYIFLIIFLSFIQVFIGVDNVIHKWGTNHSVTQGRFGPWSFYINYIVNNFPENLFPSFFRNLDKVYIYYSPLDHAFHAPHNMLIDNLYRFGILIGSIVNFLLIFPLFFSYSEKKIYISLFIYSLFEPTIGFSMNLISIIFWIIIFYLYSNYLRNIAKRKLL